MQLNLLDLIKEDPEIRRVPNKVAKEFLGKHHYLRDSIALNAQSYAFFEGSEITALVSFTTLASSAKARDTVLPGYSKNVMELSRLALAPECSLTATQVVSRGIKYWLQDRNAREMTPIYALVSYADPDQGHHGGIYQAGSWIYVGKTRSYTFYKDETGKIRHPRNNGVNITKAEALSRGWTPYKSQKKYKYLKPLNKRARKIMGAGLPFPKPKRD